MGIKAVIEVRSSVSTLTMAADSGHDHDEKKGCKKGFKIGTTMTSTYLTQHFQAASPPFHIQVSRKALTTKFRLPGMGLLWESKDQNHRFLIPNYDINPEMPRTPGAQDSSLVIVRRCVMVRPGLFL